MALDDFKTDKENKDTGEQTINIRAGPGDWDGSSVVTDKAIISVGDEETEVSLNNNHHWYPGEGNDNTEFLNAVKDMLAAEKIKEMVGARSTSKNEKISLKEGSTKLNILIVLASKTMATRPELDDMFETTIYHRYMERLEEDGLICRVAYDGNTIIWGVTPSGLAEILDHVKYSHVTDKAYEIIADQEYDEEESEKIELESVDDDYYEESDENNEDGEDQDAKLEEYE